VLQCVAVCCSVLRCCSVLQTAPQGSIYSVLQCVALCCTVLHGVAVCGRVLQCVADCAANVDISSRHEPRCAPYILKNLREKTIIYAAHIDIVMISVELRVEVRILIKTEYFRAAIRIYTARIDIVTISMEFRVNLWI